MHNSRYDEILNILHKVRRVTVTELKERLQVSEVTIRKDLAILEDQGYLLRTHGGAQLAENTEREDVLLKRKNRNVEEKQSIASRCLDIIRENDTIFIDAGTTCAFLARVLRDRYLRVVTNSLEVMLALANCPGIALHSLGGSYRMDAGSFIGPLAVTALTNFQIDTCFIGVSGFTEEGVFSSMNVIEAQLKQQVLNVSQRRVVISDHTKYGAKAFSIFARPRDVDVLVTDRNFPDVERFRSLGIEVLLG